MIIAAMDAARDQFGPAPAAAGIDEPIAEAETAATPVYSRADALVDVARTFLNSAPEDRSGEDRHLVVVHVDADLLADPPAVAVDPKDVPAGTSSTTGRGLPHPRRRFGEAVHRCPVGL